MCLRVLLVPIYKINTEPPDCLLIEFIHHPQEFVLNICFKLIINCFKLILYLYDVVCRSELHIFFHSQNHSSKLRAGELLIDLN